jgi:hypothetical protein
MKEIWIFGNGKTSEGSRWDICRFEVPGETFVKYFSMSQMRSDIHAIEGIRPHLIVNTSEPFDELLHRQANCAARHQAPIIDLY